MLLDSQRVALGCPPVFFPSGNPLPGGSPTLFHPARRPCIMVIMETGRQVCSACGAAVRFTDAGRPRNHNIPGNGPCTAPRDDYELPDCRYCGQSAYIWADPGPHLDACHSPLYHPERWVTTRGVQVGNAAAAGELVGVTGPQYQWLAKIPPQGPRRAPRHRGIRRDGVRFYDLDAVRQFTKHRPGPGYWRPPARANG